MLMLGDKYVTGIAGKSLVDQADIIEPVLLPDKGIWHPLAPRVFEDITEYQVGAPLSAPARARAACACSTALGKDGERVGTERAGHSGSYSDGRAQGAVSRA